MDSKKNGENERDKQEVQEFQINVPFFIAHKLFYRILLAKVSFFVVGLVRIKFSNLYLHDTRCVKKHLTSLQISTIGFLGINLSLL